MNYYLVFLKNGNRVFVQADCFHELGSPDCIVFHKGKELIAFFVIEEIIGCTKVNKEDLDEVLNFWKENDEYGERNCCKE